MNVTTLQKKLIPCSVIALAGLFMSPAFAAGDKQAEQIASMYLSTMVNGDVTAAKKLNDTLRPAFDGQDGLDINALQGLPEAMANQLRDGFLQQLPAKQRAAAKAPVSDFAHSLIAAIQRSKCTVQGSAVRANDAQPGEKIAAVSYTCQIADVAGKVLALNKSNGKKPLTTAHFKELTGIYKDAPVTASVKGSMDLYSAGKKGLWSTGSPDEISAPVVQALAGPLSEGFK